MGVRTLWFAVSLITPVLAIAGPTQDQLVDEARKQAGWAYDWIPGLQAGSVGNLPKAQEDGENCVKAVDAALAGGAAPSTKPRAFHDGKELTLGEIKTQICNEVLALVAKEVAKNQAADDARNAPKRAAEKKRQDEIEKRNGPILKTLTGDKLALFTERYAAGELIVRGPGGKQLQTAADFKNATTWYETGYRREPRGPVWIVSGWRFKGMTKANFVEKSGLGELPPSSAFP